MVLKRGSIAHYYHFHACAGNCHIHAPEVAQEAYATIVVAAHKAYHHHVALLPLKAVDGVDAQLLFYGLEHRTFLNLGAKILHLRLIGRNKSEIYALVDDALHAYALHIALQLCHKKVGFERIEATVAGTHGALGKVHIGGIYPLHGYVVIEYSTVAHLGCRYQISAIEPLRRKLHDVAMHAILGAQQCHSLRPPHSHTFHHGARQAAALCLIALDGGWQLAVVARQNHAVGFAHGYPSGCLECLTGFVDKERGEMLASEQRAVAAHKGRCHHARIIKEFHIYFHLEFFGSMAQFCHAVAHGVAIAMLFVESLQLPYGFAYAPQLGIIGVALKTALVAIRQHLIQSTAIFD